MGRENDKMPSSKLALACSGWAATAVLQSLLQNRAVAAWSAVSGLDEGFQSFSLPILVYMDNPYRCNK